MMCDIFERTQALSCMIQSSTLDLLLAVDMIEVTWDELADNRREDAHFDKVWTDALSLCQQCHIPCRPTASEDSSTMQPTQGVSEQTQVATSTRAARDRRLRARFNVSIVLEIYQWLMTRNHSRPQCICQFLTICSASLNVALMQCYARYPGYESHQ